MKKKEPIASEQVSRFAQDLMKIHEWVRSPSCQVKGLAEEILSFANKYPREWWDTPLHDSVSSYGERILRKRLIEAGLYESFRL